MSSTAESTTPGRLGSRYWRLWTASTISNLGDGIDLAALPLLAASFTKDPRLVAGLGVAFTLPWMLFALVSGALVDRLDRKRVMWMVNLARAGLVAGIAVTAMTGSGQGHIWALYVIAFCLGTAETLFDNAAQTILPAIVHPDLLEKANGRQGSAELVANSFVGPPLGSLLFSVAVSAPFWIDSASFLISALLIATLRGTYRAPSAPDLDPAQEHQPEEEHEPEVAHAVSDVAIAGGDVRWIASGAPVMSEVDFDAEDIALSEGDRADEDTSIANAPADPRPGQHAASRPTLRADIAEGVRWLFANRLLRTLALLLGAMNMAFWLAQAVFVLFATEVLGLSTRGFGFLLAAMAFGGVIGGLLGDRIANWLGSARALVIAVAVLAVVQLGIGASSSVAVVVVLAWIEGLSSMVWNVITVSLRQQIIPDHLLGRVNSVYRFLGWGSMPIGALLGGFIANAFGLRAPYFVGGTIGLIVLVAALPSISQRAIDEARASAPSRQATPRTPAPPSIT